MNVEKPAEPGGGPETPTGRPPDSAPSSGRPRWLVGAPVAALVVVIVGVLAYQWQRDKGYVHEADLTSQECDFEVEATSAKHVPAGGVFVFESVDAPTRYAVYESASDGFYCIVDERFWRDPSAWSTSPVFGPYDAGTGRVIGETVLGCDIVGARYGDLHLSWVDPSCTFPRVLMHYCGLSGHEIFSLVDGVGDSPKRRIETTFVTAYGEATFLLAIDDQSPTSLRCPVVDPNRAGPDDTRFHFTDDEWRALRDSADGLVARRHADVLSEEPSSPDERATVDATSTTTRPRSTTSGAPRSTTAPTTAPATSDEATSAACDFEDPARPLPEEASLCLFMHWRADNRDVPTPAATSEAVEQLFAVSWEPPDGNTEPCRKEESAYGEVICSFVYGMDVSVDMYLGGGPTGSWTVVAVGHYGNPPGWSPVD